MKLNFEAEKSKINNQEMQRENEAEKNKNVRKNNENNFQCNIREINSKAKKDFFEHEKNMQNINNNFLLNKSENDNKFTLREKELNIEFIIGQRDLMKKKIKTNQNI